MSPPSARTHLLVLALVIAGLGAGLVATAPQVAAQATTVTEDFEVYNLGALPCLPTTFVAPCNTQHDFQFTTTGGSMQVATPAAGLASSGAKAFQITSGMAYMDGGAGVDLCGEPISFAVRGLNAGGNVRLLGQLSGSTSWRSYGFFYFSLTPGGQGYAALQATNIVNGAGTTGNAGQTANMIFTNSFSSSAWYEFTIYCPTGAGAGSMTLYSPQAAAINNPPVSAAVAANGGSNFQGPRYLEFGGGASAQYDNVVTVALNTVETTPDGPELTVVGLTGFDVDRSGTTAILRTHDAEGGTQDNVRTYDAQTLATPGNALDTDCNRLRGVAALASYVAFLECDDGDETDVDFLMIRSASLGDPDMPAFCTEPLIDFCDKDIDANELAGCQGTADSEDAGAEDCDAGTSQFDIIEVDEVPFDYSAQCNSGFFTADTASRLDGEPCFSDTVYMAFGASFEDGYVGVITYAMNQGADDRSQISRVQVGPNTSLIDQMCVVQDSDGLSYMYAAQSDSQMKGYALDFTLNPTSPASSLSVDITQVFPGTTQTSGAVGVACGEEKFATVQPDGNLCVFARDSGTPLFCRAVSSVPSGGLAMSGTGDYVSWVESTTMRVGCAKVGGCPATAEREAVAIGAVVAQADIPTGTFRAMKMDANANSVWVATDVRVRHYDQVFELTTGNATACLPGDVGCGPTPTGGPTATGGPGGAGGAAGDFGAFGNFAGAAALVFGAVVVAYAVTRRKEEGGPGNGGT